MSFRNLLGSTEAVNFDEPYLCDHLELGRDFWRAGRFYPHVSPPQISARLHVSARRNRFFRLSLGKFTAWLHLPVALGSWLPHLLRFVTVPNFSMGDNIGAEDARLAALEAGQAEIMALLCNLQGPRQAVMNPILHPY